MPLRPASVDDSIVIVRPEDRPAAFLVHGLGWIPVWGFVLNTMLWLYYKNRSRELIFHIQQAVQYHIVVLMPVLAWIVGSMFAAVLGKLSPGMGGAVQTANTLLLSATITILAAVGIGGGLACLSGKPFLYPAIGRRVLQGSIRKLTEE